MKSTKPVRPTLSHKHRSSKSLSEYGSPTSPALTKKMETLNENEQPEQSVKPLDSPNNTRSMGVHSRVTNVIAQDIGGMEILRSRMNEAMAKKQQELISKQSPSTSPSENFTPQLTNLPAQPADLSRTSTMSESMSSTALTMSTDSAKTVRATFDITPGVARTPSYPFPRMNLRLQRGLSSRSGPHHRPFTLLSPTNEPPDFQNFSSADRSSQQTPSDASTPLGKSSEAHTYPEDPNYPTPDLYDMVLMLSTEPSLDAWWSNVTEILVEAYGAERASLALPGDITDLENVPWGQKASFNINGSDSGDSSFFDSNLASEVDNSFYDRDSTTQLRSSDKSGVARRPPLVTRHSIAGPLPEKSSKVSRPRPTGPTRAVSTISAMDEIQADVMTQLPRLTKQSPTPQIESLAEESLDLARTQDLVSTATSAPRCHVFRSLQRLEADSDPLLIRTGVSALFGKRKPVILTRSYTDDDDDEQLPGANFSFSQRGWKHAQREREDSVATVRAFEDYEQPEPSPWSQSPSPSPAARPDPQESPFFVQAARIDEDAFTANPPLYDYGASANQPLNAIGTDRSKTLVHIPLIQPVPSRKVLASSLRFPVAILSFISPVNPYPRNLRHSLHVLLPHLASTFSLAQQYSSLQERLRGGFTRQSASFGLGGTFSDEGSELELVAELSTQIQQEKALSKASSLSGSAYSPSDKATGPRASPTGSVVGTPFLDHIGMSSNYPATPNRSASEMVDSYFSAKRSRSTLHPTQKTAVPSTPGSKGSKEQSPERHRKISHNQAPGTAKKPGNLIDVGKTKLESPNPHRSASITSESSYEHTPLSAFDRGEMMPKRLMHRDSLKPDDGSQPLPELIAALMLNAVPLQLFLAKPTSGDLVWTNRKFDAFRSQGEGRVKDPWKNVHAEDQPALLNLWREALQTGNQFTHYIRVKRFNNDSDFRWFVFRASTMLSSHGRLLYWIGSFLDVHEQYMKNLEAQELQASMARDTKIRALADAIPQVLFEAVEGEGIVAVNRQWHTFSGQTLDEARGLGFARHVHKDDLHKCGMLIPSDVSRTATSSDSSSSTSSNRTAQSRTTRSKSLFAPDDSALATMIRQGSISAEKDENGRTSYTTEIRLRSKKGGFRWFLVRLVKIWSDLPAQAHASWYGTCTDIEVRMKLEYDLNEANKKVHSEMESKTKFFANMSHEIRTPLNGILGSMPWLVESQLDHDQRRTLDTIQNSANNLRELVDNILDVTKVEAGKMNLIPKWFNVRSLCEEAMDTCSSRAIERGLELNYTLDAHVPSTVKGDPFRMRQVLLNLMGNSVKFTQTGEVYLRCTIKSSSPAEDEKHYALLNFDVVDTGRGFNEVEFKRLFKQFGQIEGASQHDAGSGLGLFLSKQLVEMHGGELSVSSKVGEGSIFSFYVRVEITPPGKEAVLPEHPLRPSHRHSVSFGTAPSSSGAGTPTVLSSKTVVLTPGLTKYTTPQTESPGIISPGPTSPVVASDDSGQSLRSNSFNMATSPSASSSMPTPESVVAAAKSSMTSLGSSEPPPDGRKSSIPYLSRAQSDTFGLRVPAEPHPQTYSIVVICPAEHARNAIKQHIEQVIPHQIPVHVTALPDVNSFLELRHGSTPPIFTHIVLDLPASSDIMLFMRQMSSFSTAIVPALIVITDHYQKRDIAEDFMNMTSSGRKAYLVHKPVKPSVFAMIFDPAQLRNLSKDRAREVAQSSTDDFKKIANHVKETIGNRHFRLLLVEDSDTNRMVIQRYLKRVGLANDEAKDGQECIDKVRSRPHGYYSLIICDIQMPKKNGYEACVEIRQWEREHAYPSVPIMALTANAMPEERAAAGAAGFTDYLTKPVDFNRLGRLMVTLLDPKIPHTFLKDQGVDTGKET